MSSSRRSPTRYRSHDCLLTQYYPWSRSAIDLGAPIVIAAVLILANLLRHFGKRHFANRIAAQPISPVGSTLFLRAFRDDQGGFVGQAETYTHLCSISAACLPPLTD